LIILAGCGKTPAPVVGGNLQQRTFEAVVVAADAAAKNDLLSLCNVLNDKDLIFRTNYLNGISQFSFNTEQKMCGDGKVKSVVKAILILDGSKLAYQKLSGENFVSNPETRQDGTISSLCSYVSVLTQPQMISGTKALRHSVKSNDGCSDNSNHRCVTIESAEKQYDGKFLVKKVDMFLIDVAAGPLTGMVLKHEHWNYEMCDEGEKLMNVATFTGVTN
jgi:hypothetical protein